MAGFLLGTALGLILGLTIPGAVRWYVRRSNTRRGQR